MKNKLKALIICTVCAFGAVGVATMSTMPNRFLLSNDSRASNYTLTLDSSNRYSNLPTGSSNSGNYTIGDAHFEYVKGKYTQPSEGKPDTHIRIVEGGYLLKADEAKNLISVNVTFSATSNTVSLVCRTGDSLNSLDHSVILSSGVTTNISGDFIRFDVCDTSSSTYALDFISVVLTYSCSQYSSKLNNSFIVTEKGKNYSLIKNWNPSSPTWTNSKENIVSIDENNAISTGLLYGASTIALENNGETSSTVAMVKDPDYAYKTLINAGSEDAKKEENRDKLCYVNGSATKFGTINDKDNIRDDITLNNGLLSFTLISGSDTSGGAMIVRLCHTDYDQYKYKCKFYIYSSVAATFWMGGETGDTVTSKSLVQGLNEAEHDYAKGVLVHKFKIGQPGHYAIMWEMTKVSE